MKIYIWKSKKTGKWNGTIVHPNGNKAWSTGRQGYDKRSVAVQNLKDAWEFLHRWNWQTVETFIVWRQPKPSPKRTYKKKPKAPVSHYTSSDY